ncbi:SGNH hydrolase-type esterase domain-containing protein [Cladorrhinum sp. PSN259]|nr:SGNH hydrolase-type esterase domain-containing protein [Cladorrhinum sp. PSN259]
MAAASAARQKLRILCFGDSLTAGHSYFGTIYHPYVDKMAQMVQMAFPDHEIITEVDGKPGDTVCRGFLERIERHFPSKEPTRYDWAIILGGTNDIAYAPTTSEIFEKLTEVWDVPLSKGCKVLALTVPGMLRAEKIVKKRSALNELIRGYKRDKLHVYDLYAALPSHQPSSPEEQKKYWDDDHVHFTPRGYDLIGNKVGMALVSILVKQRVTDLPPAKRRRVFRNDDKVFDEETGDPTSIDQGYVIVRRTDLD